MPDRSSAVLLGTRALIALCLAWLPHSLTAAPDTELCEVAARHASDRTGVPLDVLRAIMLTETGRREDGQLRAWPWTVNMEGAGHWFDTRAEATDWVRARHAEGARSYDIGCFQINRRWHGEAFANLEEMFDPVANALYAARFLARLHGESGDWSVAAGAYHSRTATYATRYRDRFDAIRADLPGAPPVPQLATADPPQAVPPRRTNSFPLLQLTEAAPASAGSLFPGQGG